MSNAAIHQSFRSLRYRLAVRVLAGVAFMGALSLLSMGYTTAAAVVLGVSLAIIIPIDLYAHRMDPLG